VRTWEKILIIVCVLAILAGVAWAFLAHNRKMMQRIEQMESQKYQAINADSLRDVIETHVVDSLNQILQGHAREIYSLKKQLTTTRRDYERLNTKYNSIPVRMPDF
jgi:uncharacterized protein HemX